MLLRHQKEGHSDTCQTRTDLEDIAPSEVKQPQTNKYWTVPLSEVPAVLEFTETEGGAVWGGGRGVRVSWGRSFSAEDGKSSFWKWMAAMAARQREGARRHRVGHPKRVQVVIFMLCLFYHN